MQSGGDDRTGTAEADLPGNVGVVLQGEVAVLKPDAVEAAVLLELLAGGIEESYAAVVAVVGGDLLERRQASEAEGIEDGMARDLNRAALPQRDRRAEVSCQAGDGLSAETVGWIPHDADSCADPLANDHLPHPVRQIAQKEPDRAGRLSGLRTDHEFDSVDRPIGDTRR